MDEKKRAEFDEANKGLMSCPICKNYYVVSLAKNIDTSQGIEDGIFQTMKLEDLKGNVKLINDKGEERELIQFVPPKNTNDMATLFFARKSEKGDLFLTPENKKFKLIFGDNLQTNRNPYAKLLPRSFEFNVSKILVNEILEF